MIGVGKQDFDVEIGGEVALGEPFDGCLGADGHEYRGFDGSVRGMEQAGASARGGAFGDDFKGDLRHLGLCGRVPRRSHLLGLASDGGEHGQGFSTLG